MPGQSDFPPFAAEQNSQVYQPNLVVKHDAPDNYYVNTLQWKWRKTLRGSDDQRRTTSAFTGCRFDKDPDCSKVFRQFARHMQGKSCFNFKGVD